ncbi:MAG: serine/threonine protein kinase [Phycisphaerales bacterium]|nr:serine/threonine protein kinase [Phycisphaerales bacterium]
MADISEESQIVKAILARNLATADEVKSAEETQRRTAVNGRTRPLADVLVDMGFLTRTQLARLQGGASEDSDTRPAQQIPGYILQKKVGAGAMAVVYKAKQISLDRVVAVKVLPKRLSRNAEFVERFYREGRAAAALNHNNIVQAIDVADHNGVHYFVMEFVEGCTVYDELATGKVYPEEEALNIGMQIARALQHAHDRGIIHRDVKPKNIMLTPERVAKLADMGLAREATDLEAAMAEAGRAYGTPYYISPEQIRGEVDIDKRADIYSLGATLYHMVTGRVPFEGPTPSAVMHKHLREPLTPPDHITTRLTAGCAAMIEMMMSKNREERYSGCRELLVDMELLSRGQMPLHAGRLLAHHSLDSLSQGNTVAPAEPAKDRNTDQATSPMWVAVVLGAGLLVALLVILIQAVR